MIWGHVGLIELNQLLSNTLYFADDLL